MKNKLLLTCILATSFMLLAGCSNASEKDEPSVDEIQNEEAAEESEDVSEEEPEEVLPGKMLVISPIQTTLDVNQLTDCTVAISLEKGDAFVDDAGAMKMKVKVYTYDLYDMTDIAQMKPGDMIGIRQEAVQITSLERLDNGGVLINGGLDAQGYELRTDDDTTYYEICYSDMKSYYEVGEVTLPVSADFVYTDSIDLDKEPVTYTFSDLTGEDTDYFFTPHNTRIIIEGGNVVAMERVYTP